MEWLRKYFADLSQKDRESDSFHYSFHIAWEPGDLECEGRFVIKYIFDEQTNIDLVKFVNKFEAAYEIIRKWYKKKTESAFEWKEVDPVSSNVLFIQKLC